MKVTTDTLEPGDKIIRQEVFPNSLYCGTVARTEPDGDDVRIVLTDGHYSRKPHDWFEVERPTDNDKTGVQS